MTTPTADGCAQPTWNESERAAALAKYEILDTPRDARFDDIAEIAAEVCEAPIAVVNFVASDRQWFKAEIGIGQSELPLEVSICRHAILQPGLFVVPDLAQDQRFINNPLVAIEGGLRFYAGALLETPEGLPIGTVCVLDREPRPSGLTERQAKVLNNLARQVMTELELRRTLAERTHELAYGHQATALLEAVGASTPYPLYAKDTESRIVYANQALANALGRPRDQIVGRTSEELVPSEDADRHHENDREVMRTGRPAVVDEPLHGPDGELVAMYRSTKAPLRTSDGAVVGLVGISIDLTEERQRQRELEASHRLLDAVLDAMPAGVIIAEPDGRLVRFNRALNDIWGVPPASRGIDEYGEWVGFWPGTGERIAGDEWAMARALREGEACSQLAEIQPFGGGPRRFIVNTAAPVRDADGKIIAGIVAEVDVTDQVKAERALARRSVQLQALAEASLKTARAPSLDQQLDVITSAARSLIGAHQTVVSLTRGDDWSQAITTFELSETYAGWRDYAVPTDGTGIYSLVCETNRPMRMTQAELEAHPRWRGFGGQAQSHPPMRGWLAAPLIGSDGRNLGLIQLSDKVDGSDFDATDEAVLVQLAQIAATSLEQGIAEARLRASEAKFQAITESVDQMIWSAGPDGAHDYFNRRWYEFTGVPVGSTNGEAWRNLFHPDDQDAITERWNHSLATGERYDIEYRLLHRSGHYRWVLGRATPVRNATGQIDRWYGTCTDIHELRSTQEALHELNTTLETRVQKAIEERRLAEDALRQAQKMEAVGQLTGGIAHDFNNLLTVIMGNIDLARRAVAAPEPDRNRIERAIGNAHHGAERAAALTHRLLAFSRRQPVSTEILSPNRLVEGMRELLDRALGELVQLEIHSDAGVWNVQADPNQLESAILNLAVNARDAMPHGGRLELRLRNIVQAHPGGLESEYVCIEVADNGIGMTPDVADRIFEPFFTTKDTGKGTGLGLSMVYGFVRQSDGHIQVDSEPGRGTTFRLCLPRHQGDAQGRERSQDDDTGALAGLRVLVVEDDEDVRAFTADCLTQLGCSVQIASSGQAGLDLLERSGAIDVLLTDVVMPGLSGPQLVEKVRAKWPNLRVIFTSGYLPDNFDAGSSDQPVLSKPFTLGALAAALKARGRG